MWCVGVPGYRRGNDAPFSIERTEEEVCMDLTEAQAVAIITEAKNDGAFDGPLPVSAEDRIKEGMNLYKQAKAAAKRDVDFPIVTAIIAIAEGDIEPVVVEDKVEVEIQEPEYKPELVSDEPVKEPAPKKATKAPKKATQEKQAPVLEIDKFLQREGLPIPSEIDWDVREIPADLTSLSEVEVRRLHGQYHAYFSRTLWLLAQEENDLNAAEHLYDMSFAQTIRSIGGDKITAAKTEASADPEVIVWKEKMMQHASIVKKLKALCNIYEASCNRLSREWTMRSEERGTSGNLFNNR
jgi:hypothetical protein